MNEIDKTNWNDIHHFKAVEFDSPDQPGSGFKMNLAFVHKLDKLREAVKMPLIIHSGYRTEKHNDTVGGVDSSAHTSGHAADIAALSSGNRFTIVEAAMRLGFRRIGIGASFVHIDDDPIKPQDVVWLYPQTVKRTA
jgi:peptidase M15-like protein